MARVPILCRWLLNAAAPIVPRELRVEWRREWYGELWHFIDERIQSGDPEAYRAAMSHCKGALADAVYLRRNDETSSAAVQKVVRHPAFYLGAMAVIVVLIAAFTNGLESTRRMIRPLPYRSPEQIVVVRQVYPFMGARLGFPLAKIPGWRKAQTLDGIAAYAGYHALVEVQGAREVSAAVVDPEFFQVLGVRAQVGRLFQDIDPKQCVDCTVVSDELWRSLFHSDPGVAGRTYKIAGRPHKIVGVLPRGFWFFTDSPAVWTLIDHNSFVHPQSALVYAIARLRPGVTEHTSLDELRRLYRVLPPSIKARQVEEVRIARLTQDPLYRALPIVLAGMLALAIGSVVLIPARKASLRGIAYFVVKVSLGSLATTLGAIEFAYAPGMLMTGIRGFGPEAISLWLLIFGFVISIWWAWDDQRKRCPTCLCRLSMPVQMGSTELVCPQGHGVLWAPEDPLESHPKDKWLRLDESWHDLFEVTNKE
jgi:MacB-like periplasmic core domain